MSLIENERTKLFANALDRTSTACVTVGVFTPLAAYVYNIGKIRENFGPWTGLSFVPWMFAAVALHYLARRTLAEVMTIEWIIAFVIAPATVVGVGYLGVLEP